MRGHGCPGNRAVPPPPRGHGYTSRAPSDKRPTRATDAGPARNTAMARCSDSGWCGGREASRGGDKKILADPTAQFIDAVEKLGQESMQPGGQDFIDARVLQVGPELAGPPQRLMRMVVGHGMEIVHQCVQTGRQAAWHVEVGRA